MTPDLIQPGGTIGILGGGQLGERMLALAAARFLGSKSIFTHRKRIPHRLM